MDAWMVGFTKSQRLPTLGTKSKIEVIQTFLFFIKFIIIFFYNNINMNKVIINIFKQGFKIVS